MSHYCFSVRRRVGQVGLLIGLILALSPASRAAVPSPEKLLPPDTLLVISAPDWARLREFYQKSPQRKLWEDPAMKPFREKFETQWKEEFVQPLERDLGVKLDAYGDLLRGQVTLAMTQENWQGREKDDGEPGFLFLLDTRDRSELLRTNLANLRKQWRDAGKLIRNETIRGVEFSVIPLTTNDVPKTLRQFFPQPQEVTELGKDPAPVRKNELVIGQHESLLIIGTTVAVVEKVVIRLTGGTAPTLGEQPEFEARRLAQFNDAPVFAWLNARTFLDVVGRATGRENAAAPSPIPQLPVGKIIAGTGLGGIKAAALSLRHTADGNLLEFFLTAPEASRTGLTRMLTVEPKSADAPPFVPAEVVKFQRTRLDGPKAIGTIEKMLGDISAEMLNTWNFLLKNGNDAARLEDPGYDIRQNLFGNLGDDFITYEKAARDQNVGTSLLLIGSPKPDQLAAGLKGLLMLFSAEAANPKTREFLGKTIYSVKVPMLPFIGGGTLNYAASGGYVALSTDEAILEDFLRSSENQARPLRDAVGLGDAISRVGGQGTGWLAYENDTETMRRVFEMLKASAGQSDDAGPSVLASTIPFASPEKRFKDWFDFSLLPEFDQVAKYFHFTVSSGSANADGLFFRYFSPTPPQLKN